MLSRWSGFCLRQNPHRTSVGPCHDGICIECSTCHKNRRIVSRTADRVHAPRSSLANCILSTGHRSLFGAFSSKASCGWLVDLSRARNARTVDRTDGKVDYYGRVVASSPHHVSSHKTKAHCAQHWYRKKGAAHPSPIRLGPDPPRQARSRRSHTHSRPIDRAVI